MLSVEEINPMRSKHIPYFKFYPADFMNGVRGLTPHEVGVYILMLCRIYEENGPVENNELRLATHCGMRVPTFKKSLEKLLDLGKLYEKDGMISNCRADAELAERAEILKNNSKAGKLSAKKRQENQRPEATTVERPFNHTDTDTKEMKREAKASPKNTRSGSRLADDWVLPGTWCDWALSEGFEEGQIKDQADRFKDYWIAKAGAGGAKLDWQATWRNWIRKANDTSHRSQKGNKSDGTAKSEQRMAAFLRGAEIP